MAPWFVLEQPRGSWPLRFFFGSPINLGAAKANQRPGWGNMIADVIMAEGWDASFRA
jgi:hypothetical protein